MEEQDYRGGVEFGLMSTTTDRDIAVQYSGVKVTPLAYNPNLKIQAMIIKAKLIWSWNSMQVKRGMVFEIAAGRIDIGASIR